MAGSVNVLSYIFCCTVIPDVKAQCLCPCQTILLTNPFLGPWHFSYTPFVKPLLLLLLSAHFSLSLSHGRPIQSINTTPHPTISPSEHVELSLRQRRLMWQVAALVEWGWEAARPSYESDTALSPLPFLSIHYFHSFTFSLRHKRRPLFPSALGSRLWNVKGYFDALLKLSDRGCSDLKMWDEDGPAHDVEVKSSRDVCRTVSSVSYYISWFCWPLCDLNAVYLFVWMLFWWLCDYIFCLWIMKTSVCI